MNSIGLFWVLVLFVIALIAVASLLYGSYKRSLRGTLKTALKVYKRQNSGGCDGDCDQGRQNCKCRN